MLQSFDRKQEWGNKRNEKRTQTTKEKLYYNVPSTLTQLEGGVVISNTVVSTAASICLWNSRSQRRDMTQREAVSVSHVRRSVMVVCRDTDFSTWTWLVSSISSWSRRSVDVQPLCSAACAA